MGGEIIAISFGVSFVYVFLRAMQQLNVVNRAYFFVVPTSICMGLCEVTILLYVVKAGSVWLGLINGIGSGLGALLAMFFHHNLRKPS